MRAAAGALRAYPQTIVPLVPIDFSKVHRHPVVETPDCGNHFQIIPVSVMARQEVPTRDAVVDEAIRLPTGMRCRLPGTFIALPKNLLPPLLVVLVTKGAECFG